MQIAVHCILFTDVRKRNESRRNINGASGIGNCGQQTRIFTVWPPGVHKPAFLESYPSKRAPFEQAQRRPRGATSEIEI